MTHGEGDNRPAWSADAPAQRPESGDDRVWRAPPDPAPAFAPLIPAPRPPVEDGAPPAWPPTGPPYGPPTGYGPPPAYAPPPGYPPPARAYLPHQPGPGAPYPYPGYPPYPAGPLPPAPPRRSLALRLSLAAAAVLVLCGTPAVWAVAQVVPILLAPSGGQRGPAVTASAAPSSVRSPRPGDPASVRAAWMRAQIDGALATQAAALLRGDEKGFLAAGDAGAAAVRAKLVTRYRSLKALRVTRWTARASTTPEQVVGSGAGGEWRVRLSLKHCFVLPTCEEEELRVDSRWVERAGTAYLLDLSAAADSQNGPRPWELSELKASVGKRVVMATTARYAGRLPALLREAEKAAAVADRFAVGAPAPDRYRIYFAGSAEWRAWFGGDRPDWAAGYAVPTSQQRIDVVLNASETPSTFVDDIMRHEMSHVASLRGAKHQDTDSWWLVEGLAELAEMNGRSVSQHDAVAAGAVRTFIRSGKWNGTVAVAEPADGAALKEAGARYGIAFLAMRRLADRYGEAKVRAFFEAVVHDGDPATTAATEVFGAQWSVVEADCVRYIKRAVG